MNKNLDVVRFLNVKTKLEVGINMNDNKALLVMDMQNGIISSLSDTKDLIDKTNEELLQLDKWNYPLSL